MSLLGLWFGGTWTPKVCKIMAFMAVIMGLRPLLYLLFGGLVAFMAQGLRFKVCGLLGFPSF